MTRDKSFWEGLARESDAVFRRHPELVDHRGRYPWLTGALGDPRAPVWFVAENPSLTQVRKLPAGVTVDAQWSASPGDRLFREALAIHGFKRGGPLEPGGWGCYITDVVKSADFVGDWRKRPDPERRAIAEAWAPVLAYELEYGEPEMLVILGAAAEKLLKHLEGKKLIPALPTHRRIHHYSYLGSRAEGRRGPMHPDRVAEWHEDFAQVAATFVEKG